MSTVSQFVGLLSAHGSPVFYHRDTDWTPCPCLTPEGFRDPEWHEANPSEPVCNEAGLIPVGGAADISTKAFVQPAQSTRLTRLHDEYFNQLFGEVQTDDHVGIFACEWQGTVLNFRDWSQTGAEYVLYDNRKFMCVNANLVPDPSDGNPYHHWEAALRLID